MSKHVKQEEVVDPRVTIRPGERTGQLADRPSSLDGKRVTLYCNNKQNADHFLEGVGRRISEEHPDASVADRIVRKSRAGEPGSRFGLIEKTAPNTDVVLLAYGDCGACSLYTVYDAIQFERRGVPTVAYCSGKFMTLSRYDALNEGVPGLPIVEFKHPIANLSPEEVDANRVTEDIVEETVAALTSPAEEVEADYASRYSTEDFDNRPQFDQCTI